jgi:hypothetical protein
MNIWFIKIIHPFFFKKKKKGCYMNEFMIWERVLKTQIIIKI